MYDTKGFEITKNVNVILFTTLMYSALGNFLYKINPTNSIVTMQIKPGLIQKFCAE